MTNMADLRPLQTFAYLWTVGCEMIRGGLKHDGPREMICGGIGTQHHISGNHQTPAVTTETMNLTTRATRLFAMEVVLPNFQVSLSRAFLE
jgi:hypothetical protein